MTSSPTTPQPTLGTALAVTSVASVQFGAALATRLFARVGPLGTVSVRLVGAALVLCLLARPWRHGWTRADVRSSMLFGTVFSLMNVTLYLALDRLPLATVITIEFLGPLTVAVVTAASWATRVWAVPAAAGVVLIGGELSGGDTTGVLFALAAACCWATYILLSGRMGRSGSGLSGLALGCAFGAVLMAPVGLLTAGVADLTRPSTAAIGLAVGVLSSAIPYSLDLLALRRLPTAVFGVLTSLNPGVGAIAGFLVLHQTLTGTTLIGVAMVMLASVGVTVAPVLRSGPERLRGVALHDLGDRSVVEPAGPLGQPVELAEVIDERSGVTVHRMTAGASAGLPKVCGDPGGAVTSVPTSAVSTSVPQVKVGVPETT